MIILGERKIRLRALQPFARAQTVERYAHRSTAHCVRILFHGAGHAHTTYRLEGGLRAVYAEHDDAGSARFASVAPGLIQRAMSVF